jgi:proteasome lid subunit RPN8/RPN11/uncharacterized protein (UPF0248 family)
MHTRVKREIIELAKNNPKEEICGFIYADQDANPQIRPCINIAENKSEEFEIDVNEYLKVSCRIGTSILGVYHSHPTTAGFSKADIECAEETAIPFYLYDLEADKWHEYIPSTYKPAIECVPFVLGFNDCYGLVRSYFRLNKNIYLPDYDRDESYSHEEEGILLNNFDKEGFKEISISDIKIGDVIVFKTDKALPQHGAVLVEPQIILHHPRNALSRREMLTDRWLSRVSLVLRRKSD